MITYNEFKKEVEENLIFHMPENFQDGTWKVFVKSMPKVNETLDGISIVNIEKNGAYPTLYFKDFYEEAQTESVSSVMDKMADVIVNALDNVPKSVTGLTAGNLDKDKIFYQIVNRKQNSDMLKGIPHRDYLDFAVIYRIAVEINDEHITSAIITNDVAKSAGYSEEDLYSLAEVNTPRLLPAKVVNIMELLIGMMPEADIEDIPEDDLMLPMYVITNTYKNGGAAVGFLYKNVLYDLAEKLGCTELYILPSSTQETIAVPADAADDVAGIDRLAGMVMEINSTQVDLPERLSNQIYLYNSVLDVVTVVTRAAESLD